MKFEIHQGAWISVVDELEQEQFDSSVVDFLCVFRWFKFTLKPPYTITHGNLLMAIWDTSHWTSFVKFGLKTA